MNSKLTRECSIENFQVINFFFDSRVNCFVFTEIPYFKEVLIMATNCEACGYRSNEVKSGTGIEPQGVRIEVSIKDPDDMTRDILKVFSADSLNSV